MTPKRVAMVLFSYYPADPRPRRAAEALASEGMTVELICLRENATDAKRDQVNGVSVRRVPITRRRGGIGGYFYQYLAFLLAASAIILRRSLSRRYDLVYVHNMPDFLVLSGLIPRLFGAKVILDLHDPMPELMQTIFNLPSTAKSVAMLRWVEKRSIALADAVITVNRACARIFSERSCPAEKITVVMNSPDERIFQTKVGVGAVVEGVTKLQRTPIPLLASQQGGVAERSRNDREASAEQRGRGGLPLANERKTTSSAPAKVASRNFLEDAATPPCVEARRGMGQSPGLTHTSNRFIVMYHGSLVERNGLGLAVEAFARVRRTLPSAELHVYGERNAFLDQVLESVKAQGLDTAIHYKGRKPLEQIVDAIACCDVGIIPNLRSIFTELNTPTRIFEYLALGKPVIAPSAPGITDYFDEDSLIFFELGNADDLARQIEYVFHHPAEVQGITRRAQQIHLAHTWRAEKSRLTDLVSGLLRDRGVRVPVTVTAPQPNSPERSSRS